MLIVKLYQVCIILMSVIVVLKFKVHEIVDRVVLGDRQWHQVCMGYSTKASLYICMPRVALKIRARLFKTNYVVS